MLALPTPRLQAAFVTATAADHVATTAAVRGKPARDWRLLWTATGISTLGDGAFIAALPLLAATMTEDPRLVAGVTAWGSLPWLLAALPAGALADRTDGQRLMHGAQWVQAGVVTLLAALTVVHAGHIAVLYAVAFALGVAETAVKASAQTLIPVVVPIEGLEKANGRLGATVFTAKEFLGPPLGSLLFALATPLPLWVDAATFAASALLIARISKRGRDRGPLRRRPIRAEITEGLRWLARHRLLRVLTLLSAAANLCNAMVTATFVLFATERLHTGEFGFGLLLGAMAVGGVLGSLLSRRAIDRFGGRAVVTTTILLTPLAQLAIGAVARDAFTVGALAAVCSCCASLWNVATVSLRQRTVPAELIGRVSNTGLTVAWGAQPMGALLGGLIAGGFGLAAPWIVAGALRLSTALLALPALRRWPSRNRPP